MLVAGVTSIPSETLAVKLHEAGKEVSDMICMQCCRSCRSTDPTVAVPLCGYPKIRHGGAQAVRSLGFVSLIFAASRLEPNLCSAKTR